ncbi:astacin-like metalloendopeptidase [Gambusia affinis]|uniref:astacin-like metalloendopeptidase n=1 Tax=Gambusia affinis TaxID=33528 RepID=UPI001CDC85C2|nr:astacin-like metalloendopeptidase [Gambusia affinis]
MLLQLLVALTLAAYVKNASLCNKKVAQYVGQDPETLQELLSRALPVVEGDIILSKQRNTNGKPWPTTDLAYEISPLIEFMTENILAGMNMVSEHTCITFHKRNSDPNYVLFRPGKGCASNIGFREGRQFVYLSPLCSVGSIAHEILHTLGFSHEHTRSDRADYIEVIVKNMIEGVESNFRIIRGKTFGIPYDYASILHYGRTFFSINGEPTIIPKRDARNMGQRRRLTESDIQKVNHLYKCDSLKSNTTAEG